MQPVSFETFEGPLDLLLNLLTKNEIDIYDIPIAMITRQYMQYLYTANELNIELASEFITVAAQLIEIKSRMMLPADEEEGQELLDPRDELVARLLEYKVYKQISEYVKLRELPYSQMIQKEPEYFPQLKDDYSNLDISIETLASVMRVIFARYEIRVEDDVKDYTIQREEVSVDDMMIDITDRLNRTPKMNFYSLFDKSAAKNKVIACFLALLEMLKRNIVYLKQEGLYSDITIIKVTENNG
ncbi:segregation/condensation protein A [Candidatus Saccharibacteria bacterium]|nr:segregation/condensation protein A [Candidatus Saccharibacteria bacterium]